MHGGHRERQQRHEVEPVLGDHGDGRAEREQRGGRPAAEDAGRRAGARRSAPAGAAPPPCGRAWSSRRRRRPPTAAIAGRSLAASSSGVPSPVPPRASSTSAGGDPGERELREVEDDAVDRPAPDQVRHQRRHDLHDHDLGHAVHEQQARRRTGWRRSPRPTWPCTWIGNSSPSEDERGEDPELGVERAEVAPADEGEHHDRDSTSGAYEPQVEGEGGGVGQALERVAAEAGSLQAWAKRDAALPSGPSAAGSL